MDWNWFFSTFAQCGAAIIGLFGAFVISKIIDITSKIHMSSNDILNLLNESDTLKDNFNKVDIQQYNKLKIASDIVWRNVREGKFDKQNDDDIESYLVNIFFFYPNDRDLLRHFNDAYGRFIIRKNDTPETQSIKEGERNKPKPNGSVNESELNEISSKFEDLRQELKRHTINISETYSKEKSYLSSISFIWGIIIILFVAFLITVIYPLHFLPLDKDITPEVTFNWNAFIFNILSIRGVMLLFFTVIIIIVIGIFIKNLHDQKVMVDKDIKTCLEIGKYEYYSAYLVRKQTSDSI